jgi:hypothetical protein
MNLNFDINKEYFNEIKKVSNDIKQIIKRNRRNPFIQKIRASIKGNDEILTGFPKFFKSILMPLSYERIFAKEKKDCDYWHSAAVGKWFGEKGYKNISHFDDQSLIEKLTQEHIDLIPDPEKRKVAQDFFDFSRVFINKNKHADSIDSDNETLHRNVIKVPMNVPVTLYKFNWVQIRNMAKKYKNSGYYNSHDDKDFLNYIYPKEAMPDSIVKEAFLYYNAKENSIKVKFRFNNKNIEEILINKDVVIDVNKNTDDDEKHYLFLSERLFNWEDLEDSVCSNFHEMFVGDIETLLTPEVKSVVNSFIVKQGIIKEDWNKLQMKYAGILLQKGKI